jgi:hypothetical protein
MIRRTGRSRLFAWVINPESTLIGYATDESSLISVRARRGHEVSARWA